MVQYLVLWEIEVDAETPAEAAEIARAAQLDPDTLATTYMVTKLGSAPVRVDLKSD